MSFASIGSLASRNLNNNSAAHVADTFVTNKSSGISSTRDENTLCANRIGLKVALKIVNSAGFTEGMQSIKICAVLTVVVENLVRWTGNVAADLINGMFVTIVRRMIQNMATVHVRSSPPARIVAKSVATAV